LSEHPDWRVEYEDSVTPGKCSSSVLTLTCAAAELTLLTVHQARGCDGADAAGIVPEFAGVAVHDAWASYDTYEQATHALCGAHVLRELQAVTDTAATGGQWAARLAECLCVLKHAADQAREYGKDGLDPVWLAQMSRA